MADISKIKLPDGTTYNLKDSYVRTNYRALSNNDFDTINVTELNAGDLIVTGAARFLNTINGSVSGTSSNVTGTVAIANGGTGATTAANARSNLAVPNMTSDQYPTLLPTNGSNNWIKIGTSNTSYGLLPSAAGNAGSGHNYIGTSSWYWKYAYIDEIHGTLKGNADTATKLGTSTVGGSGQPIYLSAGTATACTYTLGKSVPSDADFNDTKNTAGSTDTSSKIYLIGATSQAANPQTYSDDQVYVTSGALQARTVSASSGVYANSSSDGTGAGLSLYGTNNPATYGIAMRTTTNSGKHGGVQADWAIYNFMSNSGTSRGWVWKNSASGGGNVASIDCLGNAVFNGYVGIGGNTTNTSGVRQVYNETTKSLDFVFVA